MTHPPPTRHWAAQRERGAPFLMRLTARAARVFGRGAMRPVVAMIVFYFYCFSPRARRSIAEYQQRLRHAGAAHALPARRPVYGQFRAFADAILDKLDVWQGRLTARDVVIQDPHDLHAQMRAGRGQILVGSHLGNLEVCRALVERGGQLTLNVLVHTRHAEAFNQLLAQAGASRLRLIQVTELDAAIMLQLNDRIERGEWLAIAGDRVPVRGGRVVDVDFLGAPAAFPQGPWLLAALLKCPANVLFCTKIDGRYRIALERLADRVELPRGRREEGVRQWAQRYADRLARECRDAPQQWFNFYPFWSRHA
ncbi:LpxL/LpxP family acyltransferase [Bordetella genomosp. 11]|uniref:Glycosyl transferase n=1 Tax=Bordetella genomosp. 11 TaxID=1416808 RepID=A0A261UEZ1_9BORD|nr:glycosyl transferase [Bordetella genomosp. 11]OZI60077.1 glycosyl transferase [Bordetella genomosp. 11]